MKKLLIVVFVLFVLCGSPALGGADVDAVDNVAMVELLVHRSDLIVDGAGFCSSTELVEFDKSAGVMPTPQENMYVAFDTNGVAHVFSGDEKPIFSNGRIKLLSDYRDGWPAEKKYWELGSSLNWGDGKTPPRASGEISDTEYSGPFCD